MFEMDRGKYIKFENTPLDYQSDTYRPTSRRHVCIYGNKTQR